MAICIVGVTLVGTAVAASAGGAARTQLIKVCLAATFQGPRAQSAPDSTDPTLLARFAVLRAPSTASDAWAALAGLGRQLAADLGPHGFRAVWLLSPGSPGSADHDPPPAELVDVARPQAAPGTEGLLPGHRPTYEEVADIAAFIASDSARTMTATEINLTGGAVID
jgi:NAD(P)-dependent dehydrogenase (short-subunit alcohol dehydrogenase family)